MNLYKKIKVDLKVYFDQEDIVKTTESVLDYPVDIWEYAKWIVIDVWIFIRETLLTFFAIIGIIIMVILTVMISICSYFSKEN